MASIQTSGFDVLTIEERNSFEKISSEHLKKIEMKMKNLSSIKIHLREYHSEGSKKKFSFHAKFIVSSKSFEASCFDWDFARALHKLFDKIEEEIENKFRHSDQNKR